MSRPQYRSARRPRRSCSATSCRIPSHRCWCRARTSAPSRSCSRRSCPSSAWPAARHPDLGQHHGRGTRAVRRLPAQRILSGGVPRRHRARGEHAGRRTARHARSQDGEAGMTTLAVDGLTVTLPQGGDRAEAVSKVSFEVESKEILCLVGESGSGKSVIAQSIMGLLPNTLRLSSGKIVLENEELTRVGAARLRELRGARMSMIFQEPMSALNPVMSCAGQIDEVLRFHTSLGNARRKEKAIDLLREVALPDPERILASYPHQLSGGQRQRIGIAMALALEPALLIADEPTTALDVTTQAQILRLLIELQRRHGMAVLFITHDFGVVAEIAHRVAVLREGKLVELGTRAEVLTRPRHDYTRMLIGAVPTLQPHGRAVSKDSPLVLSN